MPVLLVFAQELYDSVNNTNVALLFRIKWLFGDVSLISKLVVLLFAKHKWFTEKKKNIHYVSVVLFYEQHYGAVPWDGKG